MTSKKTFLITLIILFLSGTGGTALVLSGMFLYLNPQLPAINALQDFRLQVPLRVYSADKKLIGEFGEKRRTPVKYAEIPQPYIDALLAAEDAEFFQHNGVSIKGLVRAVSDLILTGRKGSGGSTITMQVARNYYLSLRRIYSRKFKEILLALKIEKELTKEEILELYVNVIFLGNRAYGISAASQVYYGKPLAELSLAQHAMIAGLAKGPSIMNPIVNPSRALERRNWILKRMRELDMIDNAEFDAAIAEPVTASYHSSSPEVDAPHVAEMARTEALRHLGNAAYNDGYEIYTTIDSRLQTEARKAVTEGVINYDKRHGYRGPEQQLQLPQQDALATNTDKDGDIDASDAGNEQSNTAPQIDYTAWQETLNAIPTYGGLIPAAVTDVTDTSINALLESGQIITLNWDDGLSDIRPYISENARGAKIATAHEAITTGDIIRLHQEPDNTWHFAQLPDAQAALVSLNSQNGAILSLVGGFDFQQSHFNRVTQAKRQPGSNFKPFIYTAALESGMTPATLINDAPIVFDDDQLEDTWRPENDSGKFYGPTRLRKALYQSRNLVSIRILREIGIGNTIKKVGRFGFNTEELPRDLSLALGSAAQRPLDIAAGYAVFANGGYKIDPFLIDKIVNADGAVVYQQIPATVCDECDDNNTSITGIEIAPSQNSSDPNNNEQGTITENGTWSTPFALTSDPFELPIGLKTQLGTTTALDYPRAPRVVDKQTIYLIDSILKDVIKRGTGRRALTLKRNDIGGKTGTTNGSNDAWFSGYNTKIVTTTWVGFDQFESLGSSEFGSTAALPIWIDFMRAALKGTPEYTRAQPPGIITIKIDPETGLRAKPGDPDAIFEYFRDNQVPEEQQQTPTQYPHQNKGDRVTEELF